MIRLKSFDDLKQDKLRIGTNLIVDEVRYTYVGNGMFVQCGYEEIRTNALTGVLLKN